MVMGCYNYKKKRCYISLNDLLKKRMGPSEIQKTIAVISNQNPNFLAHFAYSAVVK